VARVEGAAEKNKKANKKKNGSRRGRNDLLLLGVSCASGSRSARNFFPLPGMSKMARFDEWKSSPSEQGQFMQRVAEGETPKAVCEAMGLPYSATMRHLKSTPALYSEYRSALETWVESLAHQTVTIADDVEGTEEASKVAAAKLRCDTRFRLAAKLYREMFGEDVKPNVSVTLNLGDVAREIRELEARLGIGLNAPLVIEAEPPLPALPAAEVQVPPI
jgi:hypothetical protein